MPILFENRLQHDSTVARLVLGSEQKRHGLTLDQLAQLGQRRAVVSQLLAVAVLEAGPPCLGRLVEPASERMAGCHLLEPEVDLGLLLAQATWPQPFDQDAKAVSGRGRRVDPLEREAV